MIRLARVRGAVWLPERGVGEGRERELSGSSKEAWDGSGVEEACEGGTPHEKHYDPRNMAVKEMRFPSGTQAKRDYV